MKHYFQQRKSLIRRLTLHARGALVNAQESPDTLRRTERRAARVPAVVVVQQADVRRGRR